MLIESERQESVLTLILNDPLRRNAMGGSMRTELRLALSVRAKAGQLAGLAPLPVAAVKAVLGIGLPSLDAALQAEADHQPGLYFTDDFREGKEASQRRAARFSGA